MKFINPFANKDIDELKKRVDEGEAIEKMVETEGFKLLESHFREQLEAYKSELMIGCKTWEDYQEKRGKAFAMSLLLADIQDFIRMGKEASEQLDKLNR